MEGDCNVYAHSSLWMRPTRPDRYNVKMVYKVHKTKCILHSYVCINMCKAYMRCKFSRMCFDHKTAPSVYPQQRRMGTINLGLTLTMQGGKSRFSNIFKKIEIIYIFTAIFGISMNTNHLVIKDGIGTLFDPVLTLWGGSHIDHHIYGGELLYL